MTGADRKLAEWIRRGGQIDGLAPTSFTTSAQRFQLGLRCQGLAGVAQAHVQADEADARTLWIHVSMYRATWLAAGLWWVWTWWQVQLAARALVPRGVRTRVVPW